MICRTLAEVLAAADKAAANLPPMTQATADLVAAILTSRRAGPHSGLPGAA